MIVPDSLKRYFRKKIEENPARYSDLRKALESSRLKITLAELQASALFYGLIAMILGGILIFLVLFQIKQILKLEYVYFPIPLEFWKAQIAISILFAILSFVLIRYLVLAYPYYVANSRKSGIDASLPHAVNMMLGMVKGGVPLLSAFRFIAENKSLFEEVSIEFERIAVLAELGDLESAMRFVADTTPSERLGIFLENLIDVYRGSGDVVSYLKSKSDQFFMEKERSYTLLLESMQIIAEIYLALFIVAPLFFLIVLVVFNMVGTGSLNPYRILIYTVLPLGALIVLFLVYSSAMRESRKFGKVMLETEILAVNVSDKKPEFKLKKLRRAYNRLKSFLLQPVFDMPYTIEIKHVAFYILMPAIVFFTIFYGKMEFDYLLFSTFLAIGLPAIIFVEYRERLIKKAERELPDFLKQLASLNEAGLNVVEALKNISESEIGVINREISLIKRSLEWGELVTAAFIKLETRIRSGVFQKAISMLVKAIEASPSIKEALYTASIFSELEVEMRERVRNAMATYTIIIYLAFGVFLYTAFVLIKNMLAVLANVPSNIASVDVEAVESIFMETSFLVAIFSGLAAGIMGEGRIEAGLKHIFLLVVISYVFFKFFV
ncbi:MAG: type II secretion system F family protein [Archaeoglobaceae archaeon]